MSRGGSRAGSWATVTIRLSTEAETPKGAGDSRQRMSEMRWVHDGQCRFEIRKMDVTIFACFWLREYECMHGRVCVCCIVVVSYRNY